MMMTTTQDDDSDDATAHLHILSWPLGQISENNLLVIQKY